MQTGQSSRSNKGNNTLVFLSNKDPLVELTKDYLKQPLVTEEPPLWHYSIPTSTARVAASSDSWTGTVGCCNGFSLCCILGTNKQSLGSFTPLLLPLLCCRALITRTQAKEKSSVFSSNKDKPCLLLLTQSVTKNSSELKKNPHESCIDSSRKMKSIFHLACIQLLQEHNTTLMCCQECGSFSVKILE